MNASIVIILLFVIFVISMSFQIVFAKCIEGHQCYGELIYRSLKDQIMHETVLLNITCPNQNHVLTERPNGELACVTNHMAERMDWYIHYRNVVDTKSEVAVVGNGLVYLVPFEITGATLDEMTYEKQMLIVSVTPTKEFGVLSVQLPYDLPSEHVKYCNPNNEHSSSDTPFIVINNGIEQNHYVEKNSRDQPTINIPLNENSKNIEIVRTCNG